MDPGCLVIGDFLAIGPLASGGAPFPGGTPNFPGGASFPAEPVGGSSC